MESCRTLGRVSPSGLICHLSRIGCLAQPLSGWHELATGVKQPICRAWQTRQRQGLEQTEGKKGERASEWRG